jgi:hypothetical protein
MINTSGLASAFFFDAASDADAAIKEANKAIETAKQNAVKVGEAKAKIVEANKGQKADAETGKIFADLTKYLKENLDKILKDQKDGIAALTTQKAAVEKMRKALEALQPKPEGTDALVTNLKKSEGELDAQVKTSNEATTALETDTKKFYTNVEAMAKALSTSLVPLGNEKLAPEAKADALLAALPVQLPALTSAISLAKDLDKNWPPLATELKKITAPAPDPAPALEKAKTDINVPHGKLQKWLETLKQQAEKTNNSLLDKRLEMDKDLQANAVTAMKLLDQAEQEQESLSDFITAWEQLVPQIKDGAGFASLKNEFEFIEKAYKLRPDRTQLVREGLAGDFAKFEPDFVQLYYFSDAFSLMKALNPNVKEFRDLSALREEATRQRRLLDESSLAQASAQAAVNALQTRVRDLEDELRQAESNALSSAKTLLTSTRRLDELKSRPDPDNRKIQAAEQRKADLETEDKANQDTLTKLNDEKTGLPVQINEARKSLLDAQKLVRDRRIAMISLAQVESDAFAKARDNEPVFYADINVTSKDPVKQIQIYAFGSRRVIYLRGLRKNVDIAKDIIALFDRPAPQARLNLWTLELNSTAGNDGAKKFNRALSRVEDELSNTRARIAAALSYLRDCINEEVNSIAMEKLRQLEEARINNGDGTSNNQNYLAPQDAEDLRWARLYFYQKEVLMRLGFDPEKTIYEARRQSRIVNFNSLPDPAGTTTLGEALVILSLANAGSRHEIMKKYAAGVESKLDELDLNREKNDKLCDNIPRTQTWFASTRRALGADDQPYYKYQRVTDEQLRRGGRPLPDATSPPLPRYFPPEYAYTSMQKEIVDAITMAQVPRLIRRLRQLQKRLSLAVDQNEIDNIQDEAGTVLKWLYFSLGVDTDAVLTPGRVTDIEQLARRKNVLRTANAKVARTDLMLRQIINAVDEDMDRHFVQPMVACLRERLVRESGIGVGIVNRTSVLATNRLVARVDARSSAQLTVGETQDVLAGVQQLASLYLSAQTGGVLGGLNALGGIPQKETSEVYGLNNGSLFKVTPIFDPTGQALRFQFDYVLANLVQDPDGSINPQLPRIERHTVNTEVELNNLELREISRFSSNSRLGIPTTRKGGIPIIKDIPGVKYVPLLGWFVRRSGKSAVIQQSLLFGQTTMYPTIADIFDLLSGEDYNFGDQTCPCTDEDSLPIQSDPTTQSSPQQDDDTSNLSNAGSMQRRIAGLQKEVERLRKRVDKSEAEKRRTDEWIERLNKEIQTLKDALARPGVRPAPTPKPSPNPGLRNKETRGNP